jgi:hypothetical protein
MRNMTLVIGMALLAVACGGGGSAPDADPADAGPPQWRQGVDLPEAMGNNGVAALDLEGGCMLFSNLGIDDSLSGAGVHRRAYRIRPAVDDSWLQLPDVPGAPRLATSSVGLRGALYVLGGYSVAGNGAETSHDSVQFFDLGTGQWTDAAPLPVPIDDAVALAWRDRWIVVVSGWSNTRAVETVQIYDADSDTWAVASAFPGTAVFGHAGAIAGDSIVIVDGAASSAGFPIVSQAWRGDLDPDSPTLIRWTDLGPHPGPPRYRAAGGTAPDGTLLLHGGTDAPYNFDGLAYADGQPSAPLATTLSYDLDAETFSELGIDKPIATMDHRALARCRGELFSIGGLLAGPAATAQTWILSF